MWTYPLFVNITCWIPSATKTANAAAQVFASSPAGQRSSNFAQDGHNDKPVLLGVLKKDSSGDIYRCWLTTPHGETLLEIVVDSGVESKTLRVLQDVAQLARAQKGKSIGSYCSLSRASNGIRDTYDHRFRLCCKILIRSAGDLMDGLPFNKKNKFDHYEVQNSASVYDPWKPMDFYEHVHVPRINGPSIDTQTADNPLKAMQCQLYPFQRRALLWLLRREGVDMVGENIVEYRPTASGGKLPHGFVRTKDVDGTDCFVSHCLGLITKDRNMLTHTILRGGILAEEMGLGKTVELIALISLHRRGSTGILGSSKPNASTIVSSATLIIAPPAILEQWKNEIALLAPHLMVLIYEGIRNDAKDTDNNEDRVSRLAEQGSFCPRKPFAFSRRPLS